MWTFVLQTKEGLSCKSEQTEIYCIFGNRQEMYVKIVNDARNILTDKIDQFLRNM